VRVSSAAFDLDTDGCSVYREAILIGDGLTRRDAAVSTKNALLAITAAAVRMVDLDAVPDPWPHDSDGHKRDAAHALIINAKGLGKNPLVRARRALADRAEILAP
jgi:hypothetical protein